MRFELDRQATSIEKWVETRRRSLGLALVLTAGGSALIALAVEASAPAVGLLGLAGLSGGLILVNKRIGAASKRHPIRWGLGGLAVAGGGFALLAQAMPNDELLLGVVGAGVTLGGVLTVASALHHRSESAPAWLAIVGVGLAVAGTGTAAGFQGGVRSLGIVVALVGIVLYKIGLRSACESPVWQTVAAVAGGFAVVVGLVILGVASYKSTVFLLIVGIELILGGLIAASEGWPQLGLTPFRPRYVRTVGVALFLFTLLFVALRSAPPKSAAVLLSLLAAALGASVVWRGEGVVLLALVAVGSVWLLKDRVDDHSTDPNPSAPARVLAVGDSYMSGEGAPTFFNGTNVKGAKDTNQCRRAPTAYPYLVAQRLGMGLDFFACSGAVAAELWQRGQMRDSPNDVVGKLPQLENVGDVTKTKVVLVSIGGNDAKFGDIGQGCVVPGACDPIGGLWLANLDHIVPQLVDAYTAVKSKVPNVPVVVVPYPLLLNADGCNWSALEASEHMFLSGFITLLDERVRLAAAQAGVNFFEDGMFAFDGRAICDGGPDDTVMNFININPVGGDLVQRISPRNWTHGSLHPKPGGHQLVADRLGPFIRRLLDRVDAGMPPNPDPDPAARADQLGRSGASTVLFEPSELPHSSEIRCATTDDIEPFATKVRLFDEATPVVLNAAANMPVCFTVGDGSWQLESPTAESGVVTISPEAPRNGDTQYVVYFAPNRGWRIRMLEFCTLSQDCPNDVDAWMNDQLAKVVRGAAPPGLAMVFAGWLFAISGTRRLKHQARPTYEVKPLAADPEQSAARE